ncbi:MAG TPA: amidohydrolase family protein [Kofleriaceae bacterium]|nr:amidohydrolase family protein [Kofleriaceae bacterium]
MRAQDTMTVARAVEGRSVAMTAARAVGGRSVAMTVAQAVERREHAITAARAIEPRALAITARVLAQLAVFVAVVVVATSASAAPIAIVGAKVYVTPDNVVENATVVIDNGKITAVGAGGATPAGATVIDGKGKVVTAGLIEAVSAVGLVGVDLEATSVDGRFGPTDPVHDDPVHASYDARDGFAPHDVTVAVARTGGITLVVAAPGGALVAGQSAAYTLDGSAEAVKAQTAMHIELGSNAASGGSRGKTLELLREILDDARAYGRDKGAYERNAKRHLIADRLDLEALQPVLAGRMPVIIAADSEADIRAVLRIAKDFKLRVAITGGAEAWHVTKELAAAKVPVFVDPMQNLPGSLAASDVHDDAAKVLFSERVTVGISTLGAAGMARTLRQLAGNAVGHGLPWARALAAITTVPAQLYGLTGRGTVEKGSIADVVVWSGDPLEVSTAAETVIIGGVVQSNETHQTKLLKRYRTLPAKMTGN